MHTPLQDQRLAIGPFAMIETPIHAQKLIKPHDPYHLTASLMALSHNVIIRGLNSIYLQVPNVKAADFSDFMNYALSWVEVLDAHQ